MPEMIRRDAEFVGSWLKAERRLVEMTVSATNEFLGAVVRHRWVFEKTDAGEFSATQPSLFDGKVVAPKLGDLLEKLSRFVAAATDLSERTTREGNDAGPRREGGVQP